MTDDRRHAPQGTRDNAAEDPTAMPADDARRGMPDDLSPEHDQPVEGGVEQAEDDAGARPAD